MFRFIELDLQKWVKTVLCRNPYSKFCFLMVLKFIETFLTFPCDGLLLLVITSVKVKV